MLADLESVWPSLPVRVGAVYRQPFALTFDSRFRTSSGSVTTLQGQGSGEVRMPWMAGAGGSVRLSQHGTLAADVERRRFPDTNIRLAAVGDSPTNQSTTWVWAGGAGCTTSRFSIDGAVDLRKAESDQNGVEERQKQLSVAFSGIVYFEQPPPISR